MKELKEYPLQGMPYYEKDRKWVSPINFIPDIINEYPKKVCIYDLTLRDGEQQSGVTFLKDERLRIAEELAEMGVEEIEAGMPIVSKTAEEALKAIVKLELPLKVFAFARAHKDDINLAIDCGCKYITIEHNVNPYTCLYAYNLDKEQLIERCANSIKQAKDAGLYVNFMGWEFSRAPLDWVTDVYDRIFDIAKPDGLTVVDTMAVTVPDAVEYVFRHFKKRYPNIRLAFHTHNDFGTGVGSSLAAVKGGAEVIHCSINGIGDRTGNVSLEETVAALELLLNIQTNVNMKKLTYVSQLVATMAKDELKSTKPIVGNGIFATESGITTHIAKKMMDTGIGPVISAFEPCVVGGKPRSLVLGKNSGASTIDFFAEKYGLEINKEQSKMITEKIKEEGRLLKGTLSEEQFLAIAKKIIG